jgi:hypothetical protein
MGWECGKPPGFLGGFPSFPPSQCFPHPRCSGLCGCGSRDIGSQRCPAKRCGRVDPAASGGRRGDTEHGRDTGAARTGRQRGRPATPPCPCGRELPERGPHPHRPSAGVGNTVMHRRGRPSPGGGAAERSRFEAPTHSVRVGVCPQGGVLSIDFCFPPLPGQQTRADDAVERKPARPVPRAQ